MLKRIAKIHLKPFIAIAGRLRTITGSKKIHIRMGKFLSTRTRCFVAKHKRSRGTEKKEQRNRENEFSDVTSAAGGGGDSVGAGRWRQPEARRKR